MMDTPASPMLMPSTHAHSADTCADSGHASPLRSEEPLRLHRATRMAGWALRGGTEGAHIAQRSFADAFAAAVQRWYGYTCVCHNDSVTRLSGIAA